MALLQKVGRMPCGCVVVGDSGYCSRHDYSLVCWVAGCDLPFPHLPNGPEHTQKDCGCYYNNGGDFDVALVCRFGTMVEALDVPKSFEVAMKDG